jgi:protein-S-isoprenylcysteine O-methyltransferase Ste14
MRILFVKVIILIILVPGTVVVIVPYLILLKSGVIGWPGVSIIRILASILGVLCANLSLYCAWGFAVHGHGTPAPIDPPKVLVTQGLYKFNRNPMYVGIIGVILSEALFFGSMSLLIYAVVLWFGFHIFIIFYEEPHLRSQFGKAYQEYCRKVPRWGVAMQPFCGEERTS